MSNRFEKAEKRERVAPGGEKKSEVEATIVPSPVVQENTFDVEIEKKPEGKTYSLYLSTDAIQKLDGFAKRKKCSRSKALDTILKELL